MNESALSVSVYVLALAAPGPPISPLQVEISARAWRRLAEAGTPLTLSIPETCLMPLRD
ncbi:MAG: hypothetical protein NTW83_10145 [Cyanobacteria bacterium]|nr:hypothetical protein [Cyanobacteriota bacterium]